MKKTMYTPVSTRAASAYKRVSVETAVEGASPHELVNLLFDGLLETIQRARAAMASGDIEGKGREIVKAIRFIEEGLKPGLDEQKGGELSANLRTVYSYSVQCLSMANIKNDEEKLQEAYRLIKPLADAWKEIKP